MEFPRIKPDVIKYELRTISGEDIHEKVRRPGGFARFLSGVGRLFGAIAAPLAFLFPPAAIGAAAAYGATSVGDMLQGRAYRKFAAQQQGGGAPLYLPGLEQSAHDLTKDGPLAQPVSQREQQALDLLAARNDLMLATAAQMNKG
ncbi:MAG: hypothetical protein HYV03_06795 [Deltaproteobacteria bacterium]|nr:hypothetical protein [Deltaproteobacteria bacterium]